ncbi:peptidoglycan recognition protein family protein [Caulobacter mirabilis]|uniref:N-acetylmuramoyl-L-alanine amidase n=1 Tax=Caulobacter mirabilis TaxID=69666 RepID=A0A2D2B0N4_9CAUL|nr:N-acetylmuramoyl-L-alanine amidase [Caulobacter mirabilis]ATQ43810.1 N-acetylmuramoyl-L-alanine amidase [Caulobacter mirabilis]
MSLDFIEAPSPNFDARNKVPDMLVLHYTGMQTGEAALERLRDDSRPGKVSSHYLVEEDGRIFRLVPEERRAWHAGQSFWRGEDQLNHASIGIEIVNPGHEFGYRAFPDAQIAAVIALVGDIRTRWTIDDNRILGHSDIAPGRKVDPGELFPWKRLAEAGHGVWAEAASAPGQALAEGDEGVGVFALQAGLTRLGYDSAPSGQFDAKTKDIVAAFQQHWVQSRWDGVADGQTRATLMAVLRAAAD